MTICPNDTFSLWHFFLRYFFLTDIFSWWHFFLWHFFLRYFLHNQNNIPTYYQISEIWYVPLSGTFVQVSDVPVFGLGQTQTTKPGRLYLAQANFGKIRTFLGKISENIFFKNSKSIWTGSSCFLDYRKWLVSLYKASKNWSHTVVHAIKKYQ